MPSVATPDRAGVADVGKSRPDKRGRGRPKKKGSPINVRLKPGLKEAFAAHVDSLRPSPGLTSVIEMLIEDYLRTAGKWPPAAHP